MTALHHDRGHFDRSYASAADPWGFDVRWYEQRKYAVSSAVLPRRRFRRALEPGCSNGALTELLAPRCDELIAFDFVPAAVERAAARLSRAEHVTVIVEEYPSYWPDGTGDLVVWSEIAYYLTDAGAAVAIAGLDRWLEPGGCLLAVHYTGVTDHPRRGDAIGPWLDTVPFLTRLTSLRDPDFDLGVWTRDGAVGHGPTGSSAS